MKLAHRRKIMLIFRCLCCSQAHMESRSFETHNGIDSLLPASRPPVHIMCCCTRPIQTDLDGQPLPVRQRLKLLQTFAFKQNAIAEHCHLHPFQAIGEHREDVVENEWFASCHE